MKSEWITHHGKRIFYANYAGFGDDFASFKSEVAAAMAVVGRQPGKSMLTIVDCRNTTISSEALMMLKDAALQSKKHTRKMAVLGVFGVRKIMLQAVVTFSGQEIVPFDDADRAEDWLVSN